MCINCLWIFDIWTWHELLSYFEWCLIFTTEKKRKFFKWYHTQHSMWNVILITKTLSLISMNVRNHWQQLSSGFKIPDMKFRNTREKPNVLSFTSRRLKCKDLDKVYNWKFLSRTINKHCYKLATHFYVPR